MNIWLVSTGAGAVTWFALEAWGGLPTLLAGIIGGFVAAGGLVVLDHMVYERKAC